MSQDGVRESLGTDLSKVLLRDILGVRKYWCQLSSKQWSREYGQHVANMYLHSHTSVSFINQGIVKIDNANVRLLFTTWKNVRLNRKTPGPNALCCHF